MNLFALGQKKPDLWMMKCKVMRPLLKDGPSQKIKMVKVSFLQFFQNVLTPL
jgi:hypothetical protein